MCVCVSVCVCVCMHVYADVHIPWCVCRNSCRAQLAGMNSLLPPRRFWESNSGCWAYRASTFLYWAISLPNLELMCFLLHPISPGITAVHSPAQSVFGLFVLRPNSSRWPGTHCVAQAILRLTAALKAQASQVLVGKSPHALAPRLEIRLLTRKYLWIRAN